MYEVHRRAPCTHRGYYAPYWGYYAVLKGVMYAS